MDKKSRLRAFARTRAKKDFKTWKNISLNKQEFNIFYFFISYSGFDKELTNQKPKIKEIEFGDGGEREIIVSNQNSQIPQIQSESAQSVVANSKPDIKLSGPQVTILQLNVLVSKFQLLFCNYVFQFQNFLTIFWWKFLEN